MNLNYQMVFTLCQIFKTILTIQDIIKKHETLTAIPPINVYINKVNNRLVFQIEHGYNLELQTSETKLFGSTQKLIDQTKNQEKVLSLEVVEVVLVQCNSVDNQCQEKYEILCTFMPSKCYANLFVKC